MGSLNNVFSTASLKKIKYFVQIVVCSSHSARSAYTKDSIRNEIIFDFYVSNSRTKPAGLDFQQIKLSSFHTLHVQYLKDENHFLGFFKDFLSLRNKKGIVKQQGLAGIKLIFMIKSNFHKMNELNIFFFEIGSAEEKIFTVLQ